MGSEPERANRYRAIAEEVRATATLVTSADARESLSNVAVAYENMAATLEAEEETAERPRRERRRG
jgi:hypothetical protein